MDLREQLQAALGEAYRIERELGGGGMSRVFVAEETALRRRVVVKVLPPELAADMNSDRFRREIQLAASLQHPHIVPLFASGSVDGLLYYTMPFVRGESLRERLAREGELPVADAIRILRDVVDALAYAHAEGLVHRDIKPANILLSGGHAVVTDFGVAKAVREAAERSTLTSAGVALGTPVYMAPEQAVADPHTDHRADIYAIGIVAYEMLSGVPPFSAGSPQQVLAAQVTEAPEPLLKRRPAVPATLAAAVMRCLEKRPADRWQTAEQLRHQIEPLATPGEGTAPYAAVVAPGAPPAGSSSGAGAPTGVSATESRRPAPADTAVAEAPPVRQPPASGRGLSSRLLGAAAAGALVLAGLGYAAVHRFGAAPPAAATSPADAPKSVVVLPFENLGAPADGYFADGMTEEITSRLASVRGLKVTSRTTAMQYKGARKSVRDIGRELGAAYVLEGSVRWEKAGSAAQSRVRVTPQLIRVSDDSHMWADRYDAVLADVFEVQSKIAEQVVGALNVSLAGSERQVLHAKPAENPEAYDLYLQGVDYFNRGVDARDLQSAAGLFSRAVALDSNFARAWAMLAQTRALSYWEYYDHSPANLEAVRQSVERAFALAPDFPEVRIARGYYFYWGRRDYSAALQEFERARQNGGDAAQLLNAIGLVQRRQGRWDEALASLREAARREPRVRAYANDLGETACLMRLYDECARIAAGMIQLTPDSYNGYAYQINARLALADLAGARRSLDSGSVQVGREQMLGRVTLFWLPQATEAERREIAGLSMAAFGMDTVSYFRDKAKAWRLLGEGQRARTYYDSLRVYLEQRLAAQADDPAYHGNLGVALAWLGRAPEAVREARRGAELLPLSKDAYAGGDQLVWLAEAQTVGGMADSALANLARALAGPGWFNRTLLANDPTWAPLRSHPRYRELVAGGSR